MQVSIQSVVFSTKEKRFVNYSSDTEILLWFFLFVCLLVFSMYFNDFNKTDTFLFTVKAEVSEANISKAELIKLKLFT